jgi:hypothetical protein
MIDRLLYQFLRVLISCMVALAFPVAVSAQDSTPTTPDLIVTVRDVSGAPLPGLTVQLHATSDTPVLSAARTDAQGQASFGNISVSQVRVRVSGTLPTGVQLAQPGEDAQGIAVFLGPPPTTLDLRVDADGMVLPDPLTIIDPVPNGPLIATPAPGPEGNGRIVFPTSATYAPRVPTTAAASIPTSPMTSTHPTSMASPAAGAEDAAPAAPTLLDWAAQISGALAFAVACLVLITSLGRRRS